MNTFNSELSPTALAISLQMRAKAGQRQKLHGILSSFVAPSRTEDGCVCYYMHQAADDPDLFMVYMCWRDRAAFDVHLKVPRIWAFDHEMFNDVVEKSEYIEWHHLGDAP